MTDSDKTHTDCSQCGGIHFGDAADVCPLAPDYVPPKPWPKLPDFAEHKTLQRETKRAKYNAEAAAANLKRVQELEAKLAAALSREWIKTEDRLPKLGQWVHVVIGGVVQRMAAYLEEMTCMGEPSVKAWTWADEEADSAPLKVVTHWREFLEPPEEILARHAAQQEPTFQSAQLCNCEHSDLMHFRKYGRCSISKCGCLKFKAAAQQEGK